MKFYYTLLIIILLCSCKYRTGIEPLTLSSEYTSPVEISGSAYRASLLSNGKVYLSGSSSDGFAHEMYSPELRLWESLPHSPVSFENHGLMPLEDGRILLAGGNQRENTTAKRSKIGARVQIFDPAANTWTSAKAMNIKRAYFSLISLPDGKLMAAGGQSPNETGNRPGVLTISSVEFYDPITDTWTLGPSMLAERMNYDPIKLPDGKILMLGGNANLFSGEIYSPATNTWSAISSPSFDMRYRSQAVLADDDHVIVTGGSVTGAEGSKTTAIYTISEDRWKFAAEMKEKRYVHSLVSLGNEKVLAVGGNSTLSDNQSYPTIQTTASCEVYDMKSDSWHIVGSLQIPRAYHVSIKLSPTEILTIGGRSRFLDKGAELQILE